MDIQVFVFNYAHFEKAKVLYDGFSRLGYDTYLLNCESPSDPPFQSTDKIIKLPNVYYSGQWNESLKTASKEVIFLINSDVHVKNYSRLMNRMKDYFTKFGERAAVYSPNFYWTPWTYNPELLPHLGNSLRSVPATDSTVWALRTSLALKVGEVPLDINYLGWGIEIVAAYYAYLEGKFVVRDYGIKLEHPQATAYDRGRADLQFRYWIKNLKLGSKFWDFYNSREMYEFGWEGDDTPFLEADFIPLI